MTIVYLPRQNFELEKNPNYINLLNEMGISDKEYNMKIKPFLQKIPGFYIPSNEKHLRFPIKIFSVNGVSFTDIMDYTSAKRYIVEIPIQDSVSYRRENIKVIRDLTQGAFGLGVCIAEKQIGTLKITRIGDKERKNLHLEEMIYDKKIVPKANPIKTTTLGQIFNHR